jgi:hypothetical protein
MAATPKAERLKYSARFLFSRGMLNQALYCRSENQEVWV